MKTYPSPWKAEPRTRHVPGSFQALTASLVALFLFAAVMAPAVAAEEHEEPPEGGIEFPPCGDDGIRDAIHSANQATHPLSLVGECKEHDGTWYYVPTEALQDVFGSVPDDLIPEDLIPEDLIPEDLPDPTNPQQLLPPELNCGGYDDWEAWLMQLLSDADCNAYTNQEEILAGCDPLDPWSSPAFPQNCNPAPLPPDDPDDIEDWADQLPAELQRWLTNYLPPMLNCGGYDDLESVVFQLAGDADCNGYTNQEELVNGCNPFDPTSSPAFPFFCMPDPEDAPNDPEHWADQAALWVQLQAGWAQGAVLGSLPLWAAGIIMWVLGQAPEPPEPPEPPV